jgi:hypothetical protein
LDPVIAVLATDSPNMAFALSRPDARRFAFDATVALIVSAIGSGSPIRVNTVQAALCVDCGTGLSTIFLMNVTAARYRMSLCPC